MSRDAATKDLLKFAITAGDGQNAKDQQAIPQRSEKDKTFLKSAIEAYVGAHKSLTDELIEVVNALKQLLPEQLASPDNDITCQLLEVAGELCENIDVACDLHKIGGFESVVFKFLESSSSSARGWAANVLGSCAQNNPYCQEKLLKSGVISKLLAMTDDDNDFVAVKSLYAVSCMIRQNEKGVHSFAKNNGASVIVRCLEKNNKKLKMKCVFLMRSLCSDFKFCFPLFSISSIVLGLCDVVKNADYNDGDLINCTIALLLALSTHNHATVDIIRKSSGFLDKLKQLSECQLAQDWQEIGSNSKFIMHLLQREKK